MNHKGKGQSTSKIHCVWLFLWLVASAQTASAFALLGPFPAWMIPNLRDPSGDYIGGPMKLGEGYRWNVPVITYGFDQSFLDFFGANGVAAVDSAIQVLNNLPPASQINLTNYVKSSTRVNFAAQNQDLIDLKSRVLPYLLEQLGLGRPIDSMFWLRSFSYDSSSNRAYFTTLYRNYDPMTIASAQSVNSQMYDFYVLFKLASPPGYSEILEAGSIPLSGQVGNSVDWYGDVSWEPYPIILDKTAYVIEYPLSFSSSRIIPSVAQATKVDGGVSYMGIFDGGVGFVGIYFTGLTYDDVGGLKYLYSTNNIAMESLIPGVSGAGTNASNYVVRALRPGVEKITFQRMDYVSTNQQIFQTITNQYADTYITNGVFQQQSLQRVISKPDILFTANFNGLTDVSRTGTTNWVNNGAPSNDGPGVIQPQVVINLNRLGPSVFNFSEIYPSTDLVTNYLPIWGTFNGTTNPPLMFPSNPANTNITGFHLVIYSSSPPSTSAHTWNIQGPAGALFSVQTSTNLADWVNAATITNTGGDFIYDDEVWSNTPHRFFRTVPQ